MPVITFVANITDTHVLSALELAARVSLEVQVAALGMHCEHF